MGNELVEYYKQYYKEHGEGAYTMERSKEMSRVLTLRNWVESFVPKGGRILDVGCGDMHLSTVLKDWEWVGIDVNTEKAQGSAVEHDLMQTPYPFEAESFDAVVCSEVLEHIWDLRVVHKEVYRLLKAKGLYFISTPNFDWIDYLLSDYRKLLFDPKWPHHFEHIRQYNLDTHKDFLLDAGFAPKLETGADAHYSVFFANARMTLKQVFENEFNINLAEGSIDQILGACFPKYSHTIMIGATKTVDKPNGE